MTSASKCQPCPSNCLQCSGSTCIVCSQEYTTNSNGICVLKCELPCVTCVDNHPTVCLTCQFGSHLIGSSCVLNTTCNSDNSCTYCGQGSGYYLVPVSIAGYCSQCPQIANCLQCSSSNPSSCSVCRSGFFRQADGSCSPCHSNCTVCISDITCTSCQLGWTIAESISEARCIPCVSPCATCDRLPNFCKSCLPGFIPVGQRCRNSTFVSFRIVLAVSINIVVGDIDSITIAIYLLLMPWKSNMTNSTFDTSIIDLEEIYTGSTVITGAAASSEVDANTAASTLSAGLPNGLPGTPYTVTSSQVSVHTDAV